MPVTLVEALEAEGAACRTEMVEQHRAALASMAGEVASFITTEPMDDIGQPDLGLPLLLFAGELASAVAADAFRAELAPQLVAGCEQTVTAATLAAAGCLAGLEQTMRLLSSALV